MTATARGWRFSLRTMLAAGVVLSRFTSVDPQPTERRIALVIGSATYKAAPLRNTLNDARAMAGALRHLGFVVLAHETLGLIQMSRAIGEFGRKLTGGGVGLVYYAGQDHERT